MDLWKENVIWLMIQTKVQRHSRFFIWHCNFLWQFLDSSSPFFPSKQAMPVQTFHHVKDMETHYFCLCCQCIKIIFHMAGIISSCSLSPTSFLPVIELVKINRAQTLRHKKLAPQTDWLSVSVWNLEKKNHRVVWCTHTLYKTSTLTFSAKPMRELAWHSITTCRMWTKCTFCVNSFMRNHWRFIVKLTPFSPKKANNY